MLQQPWLHSLIDGIAEENKLPPFSAFKSQNFLHETSYGGVSGTDNDEQSLKKP